MSGSSQVTLRGQAWFYGGYSGTGTFDQSGGSLSVNGPLYLGYGAGGSGTYILRGNAMLTTYNQFVGYQGAGNFNQSGGTNTGEGSVLSIGNGSYTLSGSGVLKFWEVEVSKGDFIQSGGTNSLTGSNCLLIVGNSGQGNYTLSGTGQLSAASEVVGRSNLGTFTQTGGTNTTNSLTFGAYSGGNGTYNLNGGLLVTKSLAKSSGSATFNFGGGTLQAGGAITCSLPLKLTGTGGNASLDTAGYAVTLSGQLSGLGGLNKLGANTLTLSGSNTYTGNTAVTAGTLTLATAGTLLLDVNNSVNSQLSVAAGAKLDIFGTIKLDLGDVSAFSCNWTLVNNGGTTIYEPSFALTMSNGVPFTQANDIWMCSTGFQQWTFTEATGMLSLTTVPEPSVFAFIAIGIISLLGYSWQRRR